MRHEGIQGRDKALNRSLKQKLAARAAVLLVLAGGAVAAVTATGQGTSYTPAAARRSAHRYVGGDLAAAASYLGMTRAQLRRDLASGKTLAEVAAATSGKSAAGLIEALVAEKKQKLDLAAASLTNRVTVEVNRTGGPGSPAAAGARRPVWRTLFASPNRLGFVAASYLGVSAAQLHSDLKSGKTLAQVADATSGRSEAALIEALVTARRTRLEAAVASGKLARARANAIGSKLRGRMTRLVNATPSKRGRAASRG
jgi:hypothetical protein